MYILGLHTGHNSTACLLKNSEIISCISEERLARVKNQIGFPKLAIDQTYASTNIKPDQIDLVVIATKGPHSHLLNLSIKSQLTANLNYSIKHRQNLSPEYLKKVTEDFFRNQTEIKNSQNTKHTSQIIRNRYSKLLHLPSSKIIFANHHLLHAYSTLPNLANPPWLIFTLDAEGDGLCATVNTFNHNRFKTVSRTNSAHSLGYLYLAFTRFLNMRPNEHEHKVMGLAPYADPNRIQPIIKEIKKIIKLQLSPSAQFKAAFPLPNPDITISYLEQNFRGRGYRFDSIAAALQAVTQELTASWVDYYCKKYQINQVALSGGVFMNVKVNYKISQLKSVKKLWIMPSAGDESLALGAAYYGYHQTNAKLPKALTHLYLSPVYSKPLHTLIKQLANKKHYKISSKKNIEKTVARLLAQGKIVARFKGSMEWGARALGNRSILARPDDLSVVKNLNLAVKKRDFWMPFAPSILSSYMTHYLVNPKKIKAPYMILAFETTPLGKKHLAAAIHQYDETARPQEVIKSWNPDYHRLITEFKSLTGIGAVLNTSFNLHGYPIVCSPQDAIEVFHQSGLEYLALEDYLIQK